MKHTKLEANRGGSTLQAPWILERFLRAPRELVWEALTEPSHLARWMGPPNYQLIDVEMTVHTGGRGRFVWLDHEGNILTLDTTILEAVACERISCLESWSHGGPSGMTLWTLADREGGTLFTRCTWHDVTMPSEAERNLKCLTLPDRLGRQRAVATLSMKSGDATKHLRTKKRLI